MIRNALLLFILTPLMGCGPKIEPESNVSKAERVAKAGLTQDYFDPAAVQYRNIVTKDKGAPKNYTFCGELNGKNKFGSYTGFKRFYSHAEKVDDDYQYKFGFTEGEQDDFTQKWNIFCQW
ncbi:hypothetical protein BB779_04105 [Pseudomonas viridiflava]|uniref:hypothetical protein n=1 Tax=Pseudomonas viridiflava TaxID=33069 RepID=UPI00083FBB3F|nr:hypothetical protein [Pseudomonas viridiflava]ODJ92262.1 hypothetical protein BB779_04105 [Pseudomonas viridiflava]